MWCSIIKLSVDSQTHFNPLDFQYDEQEAVPPDVAKVDFILTLLDKRLSEKKVIFSRRIEV